MKFPRFWPCLRHFGGDLRFGPRWLLIDNEAIFLDVAAMTWCGGGLLVNIFFIMYFFTWRDVGGDYWSIFFITVDKKVIFFKDYLSIFFFFRQTWLRGPHAAPTIEGYWLIKKRIASRTCERQHSRHVFVAHVHEACMCAQGEYRVSAHRAHACGPTRRA